MAPSKKEPERQNKQLLMRVSEGFLSKVDDWRAKHRPILSRTEAIRLLVEQALSSKR